LVNYITGHLDLVERKDKMKAYNVQILMVVGGKEVRFTERVEYPHLDPYSRGSCVSESEREQKAVAQVGQRNQNATEIRALSSISA